MILMVRNSTGHLMHSAILLHATLFHFPPYEVRYNNIETRNSISLPLSCSYTVKLPHQYCCQCCSLGPSRLRCPSIITKVEQPHTVWGWAILALYRLKDVHAMHTCVLFSLLASWLIYLCCTVEYCQSRIIWIWIKKNFHYHYPVD